MGTATWRLSGYSVEDLLGAGADSDVWRGRVGRSGSLVALKRIRVTRPGLAAAAHAEAAILATIEHPNLLRIHDVIDTDDAVVLVLDLADGGSLTQLTAARGRLSPGEVISALAPVAGALAQVHAAGVVHGDVSPANVLFTDIGLPLLADLGVARILDDGVAIRTTPAFAEPSVAAGQLPTEASDVFMLGGVALYALTGRPVWTGTDAEEVLSVAALGKLDDVAARLEHCSVPAAMAAVVGRALDADPRHRGTAAEFALDLRHTGTPVGVELAAGRSRPLPAQVIPVRPEPVAGRHAAGRPATGLSVAGRPAYGSPPVVTGPALPLTHGVRPRPVITRPPARRWAGRLHARPAAVWGAAVAVALLLGTVGWLVPSWRSHESAAGSGPGPSPAAATRTAPESRPATESSPAIHPSPSSRTAAAVAAAELVRLDAIRARAFAARSPALLAQVYSTPALEQRDAALLTRLVPPGCGLAHVHTTFREVTATRVAGGLEVTAWAELSRSTLTCHGSTQGHAPGTGSVELHIRLRTGTAGYRIDAETSA